MLYEESIANGTLPPRIAVEDSCGVLYRGTQLVESVCSVPGKSAYRVTADGGEAQTDSDSNTQTAASCQMVTKGDDGL